MLGCPRCGSLITDIHADGCAGLRSEPDNLTEALLRVIDGWRKTHPDLTYFETVTVIEGIGRLLHQLRDAAHTPPERAE